MKNEITSHIYSELQRQSEKEQAIEQIVDDLVAQASAELDEFVMTVKQYLDELKHESQEAGTIADYSDHILELQCLKLPVLMYFAADQMESWALYSDIARAEYQEIYDIAAKRVAEQGGRNSDMDIAGREAAQVQDWVKTVKTRVYNKLKTRLKYADELFNGLRKVMSKRITDLEVFRKESSQGGGFD